MNDTSPPDLASEASPDLVIEALSREDGKNSIVRVYPDRIEWLKEVSISSLPRQKSDPPLIPLHTVASVKVRKDGPVFSKVFVRTRAQTIIFRMHSPQAVEVRDAIADLVAAGPRAPAERASAPPPPPAAAQGGEDLRQLELLRDEGMLTPEQFAAARTQLRAT